MVWQRIRIALLAGAIAAVAAHTARADDCAQPAPQQFCTVKVTECVPEQYTTTRTVYRNECRVEKYTAYRCETVPEERTRTCTVYRSIPEVKTVTQSYCVSVPTVEERTVMKPCYSYQTVTKMVCKTEDHGHYECREVPDHFKAFRQKLKRRHKKDCCDPCSCCPEPCPPTKTKKVWVPCNVTVQVPVCHRERVCTMKPVVTHVTVCRQEVRTREVQVTSYRCVPETRTEKYTVCVSRKIPYEATRNVNVCVPHQETVTLTRMVSRVVEKQVAVGQDCCAAPAGDCCAPAKKAHWHKRHKKAHCCD